jgi:hypothetical protein
VSAHQPAYLPWLGLLHKAALADTFVLVDTVQFERDSFINRNKLRSPEGWRWLTVPVLTKGHMQSRMNELRIAPRGWARKHWTSFQMFYGRTPFFGKHAAFLEDLYAQPWERLVDLCEHILRYLFQAFEIDARLVRASTLSISGTKSDLILDICGKTGASTFVFGALGRAYAQINTFHAAGIRVVFQDYHHPTYRQAYRGFEPGMNAFDLLMNEGPRSRDILLQGNILREELAFESRL